MGKRNLIPRDSTVRDRARAKLRKEGRPCHICGRPVDYSRPWSAQDPLCFEADHVVPLEKGGADTVENFAPSHRGCNSQKRAKYNAPIIKRSGALKH